MHAKFLDKNQQKVIKFFNKPIEYTYHTLNFLSTYNLPIHFSCFSDCLICRINDKIKAKEQLIFTEIENRLGKRPYPYQKVEYAILVGELNKKGYDYYWLRLKPRQLLVIVDYLLNNDIEGIFNHQDDRLFILQTDEYYNIRFEEVKDKKWLVYDLKKYSAILELKDFNIYSKLNIETDPTQIKTAAYLYSKIIKQVLT